MTGCGLEDYQEAQQLAVPQVAKTTTRYEEPREMDAILADVMETQNAMRDDFDDLEALRVLVNDTKTNLDTHISSVNSIRCNINLMRENAGKVSETRRTLGHAGSGIMSQQRRSGSSALVLPKTSQGRIPARVKSQLQKRVAVKKKAMPIADYCEEDDDYYFRSGDGIEVPGRARRDDSPRAEIMGKLWNINQGMNDFTSELEGQMKDAFEAIRKKKMGKQPSLPTSSMMSLVPRGGKATAGGGGYLL